MIACAVDERTAPGPNRQETAAPSKKAAVEAEQDEEARRQAQLDADIRYGWFLIVGLACGPAYTTGVEAP